MKENNTVFLVKDFYLKVGFMEIHSLFAIFYHNNLDIINLFVIDIVCCLLTSKTTSLPHAISQTELA